MKCLEVENQLSAYMDGELLGAEADAVGEHLAGCPVCRRMLLELEATSELVGSLPRLSAPPGLAGGVLQEVRLRAMTGKVEATPRVEVREWVVLPRILAAAAAVIVIFSVGLFVFKERDPDLLTRVETPRVVRGPSVAEDADEAESFALAEGQREVAATADKAGKKEYAYAYDAAPAGRPAKSSSLAARKPGGGLSKDGFANDFKSREESQTRFGEKRRVLGKDEIGKLALAKGGGETPKPGAMESLNEQLGVASSRMLPQAETAVAAPASPRLDAPMAKAAPMKPPEGGVGDALFRKAPKKTEGEVPASQRAAEKVKKPDLAAGPTAKALREALEGFRAGGLVKEPDDDEVRLARLEVAMYNSRAGARELKNLEKNATQPNLRAIRNQLVLEPAEKAEPEEVLMHLFARNDLEPVAGQKDLRLARRQRDKSAARRSKGAPPTRGNYYRAHRDGETVFLVIMDEKQLVQFNKDLASETRLIVGRDSSKEFQQVRLTQAANIVKTQKLRGAAGWALAKTEEKFEKIEKGEKVHKAKSPGMMTQGQEATELLKELEQDKTKAGQGFKGEEVKKPAT
ncbi:MAG: zf-HC2 domain-containing protein, partial [Planctomycetia bacterium]|nr:zf-HC2 domain-containing protein [Planctomycetia bacterium]